MSDKCNHCGRDPHSPWDGKPLVSFDGKLLDIGLRKKVDGTPPLYVYDALFEVAENEPTVAAMLHRHGPTSNLDKLGHEFTIKGATFGFTHGQPPSRDASEMIGQVRGCAYASIEYPVTLENLPAMWLALLDYIRSLELQAAQNRLVIQVSDVKVKP